VSVFFYFYTFLTFFLSLFCLSVCLVLWASLPEIKIDDDDDDDLFYFLSDVRTVLPTDARLGCVSLKLTVYDRW